MSGATDGTEQLPDVYMGNTKPRGAPAKPDVILTEAAQASSFVLEKNPVETVNLAPYSVNVDKSRADNVTV